MRKVLVYNPKCAIFDRNYLENIEGNTTIVGYLEKSYTRSYCSAYDYAIKNNVPFIDMNQYLNGEKELVNFYGNDLLCVDTKTAINYSLHSEKLCLLINDDGTLSGEVKVKDPESNYEAADYRNRSYVKSNLLSPDKLTFKLENEAGNAETVAELTIGKQNTISNKFVDSGILVVKGLSAGNVTIKAYYDNVEIGSYDVYVFPKVEEKGEEKGKCKGPFGALNTWQGL